MVHRPYVRQGLAQFFLFAISDPDAMDEKLVHGIVVQRHGEMILKIMLKMALYSRAIVQPEIGEYCH